MGSIADQIATCEGNTDVEVLMPLGVDPHDYQPSSAQLALLAESGFVVANGLMLEESLVEPLEELEQSGGTVFRMAQFGEPLPFGGHDDESAEEHDHDHNHDHGEEEEHENHSDEEGRDHDHGGFDPHFWLDMSRVADATDALGVALEAQYGEGFVACAAEVSESIRDSEDEVIEILAAIPDDNRVLVTDHDALGYFAERYDFEVAGVVIPGGSTLAEASSQDLAALVAEIESRGLTAMFGNFHVPSDLLDAVAEESGGLDVVPLYIGSIGEPGSDQGSYQEMMIYNARQMASALGN
jgi:zinc/manganese transport system substrate-binding protein